MLIFNEKSNLKKNGATFEILQVEKSLDQFKNTEILRIIISKLMCYSGEKNHGIDIYCRDDICQNDYIIISNY